MILLGASEIDGNTAVPDGGGVWLSGGTMSCSGAGVFGNNNSADGERDEAFLTGDTILTSSGCDWARDGAKTHGEVHVDGVGTWTYGEDADFVCESAGCSP